MAKNEYREVAVLRDDEGVSCVITQKVDSPHHSFSLVKEFKRGDEDARTSFLNRRHIDAARRLLNEVEAWLDRESDLSLARAVRR
jgi:hypothetical protein